MIFYRLKRKFISQYNLSAFKLIIQILFNLQKKFKKKILILLFLIISNGLFESLTIVLLFSFLSLLINPNILNQNQYILGLSQFLSISKTDNILILIAVLLTLIICISGFIRIGNLWVNSILSESIGSFISTKILKGIISQPYIYHLETHTNEIINAATFFTRVTSTSIQHTITIISSVILVLSVSIPLFIVDYKISFIILFFALSIYLLIGFFTRRRIKKNSLIQFNLANKQIEIIQIILSSIKEILLGSKQNFFLKDYSITDRLLRRKWGETRFLGYYPKILIETFVFASVTIIALLIFRSGETKLFLLPIFGTLLIALQKLLPYTQQIFTSWANITSNKDAIQSVSNFLELKTSSNFEELNNNSINFNNIELRNIDFIYPNSKKFILKDFSLNIKKGSKVGIKGESGKGKSTLINILMGLLIANRGKFIIDQNNLYSKNKELDLIRWRSNISHVPQKINLIKKDFISNIAFGVEKDNIDFERVKLSAKIAQIADFINSQKNSYFSPVGDNGSLLSGGQIQRLGIARAIYKNCKVLILDEATNELDEKTEGKILNSIFNFKNEITIIFISHNSKSLGLCDYIINI